MEPPSKRQRHSLNQSPAPTDDDFDLQTARARNDQKLKSLFEGIFEKYGRDFSDIGDEIDLRTGEIVVNKGHVLRMQHEDDTGELSGPKKAISQLLSDQHHTIDTLDASTTPDDGEFDPLPPKSIARKQIILDNESQLPSSHTHKQPPKPSRPTDPRWQAPEIDAKFWTPPHRETAKETSVTPRKEHLSSPTTTSVWAVRTPGRPRGSTSKKQTSSNGKRPLTTHSKRKRKSQIKLDWSFAHRGSDDSDSDDPLQQAAPPSSNRSVKIRARSSIPLTSKSINLKSNTAIDVFSRADGDGVEPEEINYDEPTEITTPRPETPEAHSSSPATAYDTPTQKRYVIDMESPTFLEPEEVILTPDEVKLIIRMKFEDMDMSWEEIVQHLPGRTLTDLLNWVDHRPHLLDGMLTSSGWSQNDLEKLHGLACKSGIWWRDFQALFPHRPRKEIEDQAIRLWAQKHLEHTQPCQDDEQKTVESGSTKQKRSRTPYSDENDTALKTGDVMTNDDLQELLDEESDNDRSEISAIDAKAREAESLVNLPRGSPRKGSASPRKYY